MSSKRVPNYLRANRKRSGLSQDEVAYLLGAQGGAKVSRYERFARAPSLECILAYEVIFHKPASELFAGLYKEIQEEVVTRAKALAEKMVEEESSLRMNRKREALEDVIGPEFNNHNKQS